MEYMRTVPDKYFELAIVDVPYGIKQGGDKNKTRGKLAISKDYHSFNDDKPPEQIYYDELFRISKNQIIWGANHFISKMPFDSSCWIVWDKDNDESDFADCELAWASFNTTIRIFRFRWNGMLQGDMGNKEMRIHPTQKPVALYRWLLKKYAKEGDKILDTHVGSGSSLIACKELGFDYVGCEIDQDYFEAAQKRINKSFRKYELFEGLK